jgi:hypothetical protein
MSERTPESETELVELIRAVDVRAPSSLHARVRALVDERGGARARGGRMRTGLVALPVACAVVALILVFALSGGGAQPLTLGKAVALTLRPATRPAPAENPRADGQLMANVDGVAFPYWSESLGWRATGARSDRVDGRAVTTVFYAASDDRWVGYAIIAGTPAPRVSGGALVHRAGEPYRLMIEHGALTVTWLRDGRMCILVGHGVGARTLLALASWRSNAATAS